MFAIYSSPLQIVPRFVNLLTIFPYHPWLLGWIINLVRIWAYHWTCTFIIGPILFFILACYFLSRCISRFLIQFSSGTPGNRMKAIFSRTPSFTNNKADAINFFFFPFWKQFEPNHIPLNPFYPRSLWSCKQVIGAKLVIYVNSSLRESWKCLRSKSPRKGIILHMHTPKWKRKKNERRNERRKKANNLFESIQKYVTY